MSIQWSLAPQGSEEWLAARKGVITASRFRDARDKLKGGAMSKAAMTYAMDVARERCGGAAAPVFVSSAMRTGTEQEPIARMAYEDRTGLIVQEVGFAYTEDRLFGGSVDGLIEYDGLWECKAMVSSDTLFTAMVDGDVSAYVDQCQGGMWLLGRKWCDLSLWCPDLGHLHTIRINRDDDYIAAMETELLAFNGLVEKYAAALRMALKPAGAPDSPPWAEPSTPTPAKASTELVADPFAV